MDSTLLILIVVVLFLVLLVGAVLATVYNRLVNGKMQTENAWSQIDVQLRRRYDLIPNIVETVKGYAGHERETLEKVIQARNMAVNARGAEQTAQAENMLSGALKSLFAVTEAYPNLKANQNFMDLQEELKTTENRIGLARQFYNDMVGRYNATLLSFPTNIIGNLFGFQQVAFFQLNPDEVAAVRAAPQVKF